MRKRRELLPCWQEDKGLRSSGRKKCRSQSWVMDEGYLGALGTPSPGREVAAAVETPSSCKAEGSHRS